MLPIRSCVKQLSEPGLLDEDGVIKLNTSARWITGLTVGDALLFITALVLGVLGMMGFISGMPLAAAYALVGVSGGIASLWIVYTITANCIDEMSLLYTVNTTLRWAISSQTTLREIYNSLHPSLI